MKKAVACITPYAGYATGATQRNAAASMGDLNLRGGK